MIAVPSRPAALELRERALERLELLPRLGELAGSGEPLVVREILRGRVDQVIQPGLRTLRLNVAGGGLGGARGRVRRLLCAQRRGCAIEKRSHGRLERRTVRKLV